MSLAAFKTRLTAYCQVSESAPTVLALALSPADRCSQHVSSCRESWTVEASSDGRTAFSITQLENNSLRLTSGACKGVCSCGTAAAAAPIRSADAIFMILEVLRICVAEGWCRGLDSYRLIGVAKESAWRQQDRECPGNEITHAPASYDGDSSKPNLILSRKASAGIRSRSISQSQLCLRVAIV